MTAREYVFTSESVTEGHPDKVCDAVADAILDAVLTKEAELEKMEYVAPDGSAASVKNARCAIECLVTTGIVIVAGEIRTQAYIDIQQVVRNTLRKIGYDREGLGFAADEVAVINLIHEQSPDIAQGVDGTAFRDEEDDEAAKMGAGDQGIVFGYATNETSSLMPLPIDLANKLAQRLSEYRRETVDIADEVILRPDGKTQVSVSYIDGKPVGIDTVLISTSHDPIEEDEHHKIFDAIYDNVIKPVMDRSGLDWSLAKILVNPTGRFVICGPQGDTGVTSRKLAVDTYGGMGKNGGGGLSGKDASKVDRSGAYAARWVAKNIVAAGLADKCEVQISYAIGVPEPVSIMIDTKGTAKYDEDKIDTAVAKVFDLRPGAIIRDLKLREPLFSDTAAFGHYGRDTFPWEQLDKVKELKKAIDK